MRHSFVSIYLHYWSYPFYPSVLPFWWHCLVVLGGDTVQATYNTVALTSSYYGTLYIPQPGSNSAPLPNAHPFRPISHHLPRWIKMAGLWTHHILPHLIESGAIGGPAEAGKKTLLRLRWLFIFAQMSGPTNQRRCIMIGNRMLMDEDLMGESDGDGNYTDDYGNLVHLIYGG